MKKLLCCLLFFQIAISSWGQDVPNLLITEIMYNDPSGPDSLEYLEIYNHGSEAVEMTLYQLAEAVTFTFPEFLLEAGAFVIVAKEAATFENTFGLPAFQWDASQGLNNTGETIRLLDAGGELVTLVTYADGGPWPSQADGSGPSLVFCDLDGDNNNPANWTVASTPTGIVINGIEVLANPGSLEDCEPPGPQEYPAYPIGLVTTNDIAGVVDSLGVSCQLQGVVYGGNLRPGGLQFTIIDDDNDGIHVFSSAGDFGYSVTEGDEVIILGAITQFNGLTQIIPDSVMLISSGNPLFAPTVVTGMGEDTESQLIKIENVNLVDPSQWTNTGSGFNVDITNGTNTFQLRIDNDVDIFGMGAPTGVFSVTGLGGQFDSSSPFTEGYQILPRYAADIDPYIIGDTEYPFYPIGLVTTNDAEGRPDSLGVSCELRGIVYGVNLRPGGLQFTIIDENNDGIGVFNSTGDFGYEVKEGDEISVKGEIDFFNGLTQIAVNNISLLSSDNPLNPPTEVTQLNEDTESQLVRINGLNIVNPGQWTNMGSGFNVTVSDGVNTFEMRIDADVDIFGVDPPDYTFDLIGIGGQFDNSSPYDEGYQILPRYMSDIIKVTGTVDPRLGRGLELFPNPVMDLLNVKSDELFEEVFVSDMTGRRLISIRPHEKSFQLDLGRLPAGFYLTTFVQGNRHWTEKLAKE